MEGLWWSYPVMNVTRKPNRRRIHPETVRGQRKYAPKYAADKPDDILAVMLSSSWKWELRVSRRP